MCVCASSSTSSAGDIFSSSLQQQLFHRDKNSDSSHSASLPLPPHSTPPLPPPSPLQAVNYIAFTEKVLMSMQTKWWKCNETNGKGRGELLNRDRKEVFKR